MATETKTFASDAGHWYDAATGEPRYTVIAKNGNERPSTLRDARLNGWLPSVTTILGVARKPGLEMWLEDQAYQSAFTTPAISGETYDAWKARVKAFAAEEATAARDRGTEIHGALEMPFQGKPVPDEFNVIVERANAALNEFCGEQAWRPERSFSCREYGYGGKVDLHSDQWVVDWKTKSDVSEKDKLWDEHFLQLAAYRYGLQLPAARCAIAYVDRVNGFTRLIEADEDDLANGMAMFRALLAFYRAKNRYAP